MNERKSNFHNQKSSITGEGRHSCAFATQKATLLELFILTGKSRTDHHPITVLKGLHYKERKIPNSISIQVLF